MKEKTENFIQGVIALMFSQVAVKILGMIYSLYLTNKNGFGDVGNAICISAYQIYAIFLTISSIGIPNAISKLVAEELSVGNIGESKRILKIALCVFSLVASICSIILYFFADFFANSLLEFPPSATILRVLAPSIVFVSMSSVIRGYFNGKQKVKLSAKIQTIEQIIKTVLTIILVEFIASRTNFNTEYMAKVSMFAASLATVISFIYTLKEYFILERDDRFKFKIKDNTTKNIKIIIRELIRIVIPISLTSFLTILENNIDSLTIIKLLKDKIGENSAREKYGIISSKVNLLTNLALALNSSVAVAIIPQVARANAKRDTKLLEEKIEFSFLITIIISVPIMFGFLIYSSEIISFLYPNANEGSELLKLASITIIFTSLTQTMSGILQGIGKVDIHLKILIVVMPLKGILNVLLIKNELFLEKGAILSSIICDIVIFILMVRKINKTLNLKIVFWNDLIKVICITLMAIIISKIFVLKIVCIFRLKFIIEILILGIIYIILIFLFKILNLKVLKNAYR